MMVQIIIDNRWTDKLIKHNPLVMLPGFLNASLNYHIIFYECRKYCFKEAVCFNPNVPGIA